MLIKQKFILFLILFNFSSCFDFFNFKLQFSSKIKSNLDEAVQKISLTKFISTAVLLFPLLTIGSGIVYADDELAEYASKGNKVGVDGQCFMTKCALETGACGNDLRCLKGLSCLARCKGGSLCSTGCFAKFGGENLDKLIHCSVEKNDCVHVPREGSAGWTADKLSDLPSAPLAKFNPKSLSGSWYKVMGLDSRYDCYDCQQNTFVVQDKNTLDMTAAFRIPRPKGFMQNNIHETLSVTDRSSGESISTLQSQGDMFGLTFWENWYILGEYKPEQRLETILPSAYASSTLPKPDLDQELKLVYYTGHTLQGNYRGAFVYSRSPIISPKVMLAAKRLIKSSNLDPKDFCIVHNQCFLDDRKKGGELAKAWESTEDSGPIPFWYIGQRFFQDTEKVAEELADWFQDPSYLSEWLLDQQERMIFEQPMEVSPFASLRDKGL